MTGSPMPSPMASHPAPSPVDAGRNILPRRWRPRNGGIYLDATFGGGGYARGDPALRRLHGLGDRPRSRRHRPRRQPGRAFPRPPAPDRGPLRRHALPAARPPACIGSTAWCSTSACRHSSSTNPSAAFPSAPRGRSTCAWDSMGRRRPTWSTRCQNAIWPICCSSSARNARPAASPAPLSPRAPRRRSRPPAGSHPSSARAAARPLRHRPRHPQLPGAAHPGERRTRRDRACPGRGGANCWHPAAGWSWWRSIRWKTASSSAS